MYPQRRRADRSTAGADDVDPALGPTRPECRAPRDHLDGIEVTGELGDVDDRPANHPGHLSQTGVAGVVVGKILQEPGGSVEPQPTTGRAIPESHAPPPPECSAR